MHRLFLCVFVLLYALEINAGIPIRRRRVVDFPSLTREIQQSLEKDSDRQNDKQQTRPIEPKTSKLFLHIFKAGTENSLPTSSPVHGKELVTGTTRPTTQQSSMFPSDNSEHLIHTTTSRLTTQQSSMLPSDRSESLIHTSTGSTALPTSSPHEDENENTSVDPVETKLLKTTLFVSRGPVARFVPRAAPGGLAALVMTPTERIVRYGRSV